MAGMVDDETIYESFATEKLSDQDYKLVCKFLITWADSMEKLPEDEKSVRLVFGACVNIIETMGPAYCRVAATTLLRYADEQDDEENKT